MGIKRSTFQFLKKTVTQKVNIKKIHKASFLSQFPFLFIVKSRSSSLWDHLENNIAEVLIKMADNTRSKLS